MERTAAATGETGQLNDTLRVHLDGGRLIEAEMGIALVHSNNTLARN